MSRRLALRRFTFTQIQVIVHRPVGVDAVAIDVHIAIQIAIFSEVVEVVRAWSFEHVGISTSPARTPFAPFLTLAGPPTATAATSPRLPWAVGRLTLLGFDWFGDGFRDIHLSRLPIFDAAFGFSKIRCFGPTGFSRFLR
jgi:hypothetical protein